MKSFPMFIGVASQRVAIFGGGEQAAQKARLLLKTEAEIVLVAETLDDELIDLVTRGAARHVRGIVDLDVLKDARIAFVATGCAAADASIAALAREFRTLVNVVDRPDLCDLTTPAIVDRDPVIVAIGTEGAAPVLARQIKTRLEEMLEPRLGELTALAGRLRGAVAQKVDLPRRRAFWRWVFTEAPRKAFAAGREREAAALIKSAIDAGGETESAIDGVAAGKGFVSLVGAGPGSADLITLRGVQRLQEADVVFYDRLIDPRVLELARRDAERVYVGKKPGQRKWPQERINGVITAAAREGKRVVRLKCGDPLVFGRAAEEAEACDTAGIAWEVVPGVTAALAAAAEAKLFPTERGATQHLLFSTGAAAEGEGDPDFAAAMAPGTTGAYYMCVANAPKLAGALRAKGAPDDVAITICENAETASARRIETTLGDFERTLDLEQPKSPAILFVKWSNASIASDESRISAATQP